MLVMRIHSYSRQMQKLMLNIDRYILSILRKTDKIGLKVFGN